MLQKNLGGGCRSVEEVLQTGVLEGVLGMLHKGCMKDVTPELYFSVLHSVSQMLLGFGISRKKLVD